MPRRPLIRALLQAGGIVGIHGGVLSPVISVEYRFLATVPYLAPKLPEGPTLYVRPMVTSRSGESLL